MSQVLIDRALSFLETELLAPESSLTAPEGWEEWLTTLYPHVVEGGFADHHREFWRWVWDIQAGQRCAPYAALFPRGGGKSSSAELACAALGARKARKFVLYVSETQQQADDHVAAIASLLEGSIVEAYYPRLAQRKLGKYGNSKGWKVSRLRCDNGFSVVAIGLDTAGRGIKLDEFRPDLIVLDDIDGELDTPAATEKKIKTITQKILPAGANHATTLFIQNVVHENSIAARLAGIAEEPAEFLQDITVSGPIPAVFDLEYEQDKEGVYRLTGGTASWSGQDLETCQNFILTYGITAFLRECQHEVSDPPGGIFSGLDYLRIDYDDLPELVRSSVWVDPAVTSTDKSDSMGIQADGLGTDGKLYRLWSWEQVTSPEDALNRAIRKAIEIGADTVGVETDQGGDTWRTVFNKALEDVKAEMKARAEETGGEVPFIAISYESEKAGSGHGPKTHRAQQMLVDYERGKIVHVRGTHVVLERALHRFGPPKGKPYDLVDACYWSWRDLSENQFLGAGHMHF